MTKTIKVRFTHGVFVPLEKVELPEGEEFTITIPEDEKTISLAREAEEAFSRNDFSAALEKLRELQRIVSPEKT